VLGFNPIGFFTDLHMRAEPAIALEVKIHRALANAVASCRDRNDGLPGTV
jgi:hypothetical protein